MYIAVIIVLASILVLAGLYVRLTLTPQYAWKKRLMAVVHEAEDKSRNAKRQIQQLQSERARARSELASRLKSQIFQTMSVDLLKDYPGIGDATVQRLRDCGLHNISEVLRHNLFRIDGFGPARVRDLTSALANLDTFAAKRAADSNDPIVRRETAQVEEEDRQKALKISEAEAIAHHADGVLQEYHGRRILADRINLLTFVISGWAPQLSAAQLVETYSYPPFKKETVTSPPAVETVPAKKPELIPTPVETKPSPPPEPPKQIEVSKPPESPKPAPLPPPEPTPLAPPTPLESLKAVADLGLAVAKADGKVAASERKQLSVFLERRFAPTPELKSAVPNLVAVEPGDILSLSEALWEVKRCVSPGRYGDLYQLACSVADASGGRNAREIATLEEIKTALGIDESKPAQQPASAPVADDSTELNESISRQRLEIAEGITLSAELIRRQYRLLSERYEHTRFAGTDAEFAKLAEQKRKAANSAAEFLMKAFNEPLLPPDQPKPPADDRHNPDLDAVFGG